MGKLYLVCFGISSKTLKTQKIHFLTELRIYKVSLVSLFLVVNFSNASAFHITILFDKFRNVLKNKTIYIKKWGNYILYVLEFHQKFYKLKIKKKIQNYKVSLDTFFSG